MADHRKSAQHDRLKEALRRNLKRRKAQAKKRDKKRDKGQAERRAERSHQDDRDLSAGTEKDETDSGSET